MILFTVYTYLVTNYNNPTELGLTVWFVPSLILFVSLTPTIQEYAGTF